MGSTFRDISKYFAANIVDNALIIGRILFKDDTYHFARDSVHGPFNLVANPDDDVIRMVHIIGEIHPSNALEGIINADVTSCLYLSENTETNDIEVRTIHKGIGTSIYSKQECPLILWNPSYEKHGNFDVIDIQNVFNNPRLKDSFTDIICESLREHELFPPLVLLKK